MSLSQNVKVYESDVTHVCTGLHPNRSPIAAGHQKY